MTAIIIRIGRDDHEDLNFKGTNQVTFPCDIIAAIITGYRSVDSTPDTVYSLFQFRGILNQDGDHPSMVYNIHQTSCAVLIMLLAHITSNSYLLYLSHPPPTLIKGSGPAMIRGGKVTLNF